MRVSMRILHIMVIGILLGVTAGCAAPTSGLVRVKGTAVTHSGQANCQVIDGYAVSPGAQRAARRYWTPKRMRTATGFDPANLPGLPSHHVLKATLQRQCAPASAPTQAQPAPPQARSAHSTR